MSKFWNMQGETGQPARLNLYGYIGRWMDIDSRDFAAALEQIGDSDLEIFISSDGGDPITALTIYSMLTRHKGKITFFNDGIVASAAVIITCVPNATFVMPTGTMLMTHDVAAEMWGYYTAKELRDYADAMETVGMSILEIYAKKTGKTTEQLAQYMEGDNYFTAAEAVEVGFADQEQDTGMKMAACIDRDKVLINGREFESKRLKNLPERFLSNKQPASSVQSEQPGRSVSNSQNPEGGKPMDLAKLKAEHPDLYNQVFKEGVAAGEKSERERFKNIDALDVKGHAALVNKAKYDEPVSAESLAYSVVLANKAKGQKFLNDREDDASELDDIGAGDGDDPTKGAKTKKEEGERQNYQNGLRTGFNNRRN